MTSSLTGNTLLPATLWKGNYLVQAPGSVTTLSWKCRAWCGQEPLGALEPLRALQGGDPVHLSPGRASLVFRTERKGHLDEVNHQKIGKGNRKVRQQGKLLLPADVTVESCQVRLGWVGGSSAQGGAMFPPPASRSIDHLIM